MNTRLRTAACLMAALWLTACGGGASEPIATTADSCSLTLLYADGFANGSGIPIGNSLTESQPRQFNPCALKQIKSARVHLCLQHPDLSELTAQLRLPDNTTVKLGLQNLSQGGKCLTSGNLYTVPLTASVLGLPNSGNGNWTVGVTDTNPITTAMGIFEGWSMQVEGFK